MKQALLAAASRAAGPEVVFASSTSGLLPTDLQAGHGAPRAPLRRPSLQPGLPSAAGRGRRRRSAPRPGRRRRAAAIYESIGMKPLVLSNGDRRLRRRPPARGALARGAVARERRRRHGRGDRRRDPLRRGASLVVHGQLPDLPDRRRRGRHAALHGPVRPGAQVAVDEAHRRAGADRRPARPHRRPVRRPGRREVLPRPRAASRRLPRLRPAGPAD